MKTSIIVQLHYQATHQWEGCNINAVSFLKHPHRHIFYIKCTKPVKHEDRDIEIIMLKNAILTFLNKKYYSETLGFGDFGGKSCEMIASEILNVFELSKCEVLEDNENGAEVSI